MKKVQNSNCKFRSEILLNFYVKLDIMFQMPGDEFGVENDGPKRKKMLFWMHPFAF